MDRDAPEIGVELTVIATDRCAEKTISVKGEPIDLRYSGKAHHHGGNIQALSAPCHCGHPTSNPDRCTT
ncbi:hypothetical protein [Streptosporangium sp. NBC_01469]|uniref:hypothetical protein n=1 Tax=Streptosporangium sp. NBC_01469 TaxID=2903898 RepID=UPI002E27B51B|nr:hypothetical protein [Streptosporangium sp. NBC_01469]